MKPKPCPWGHENVEAVLWYSGLGLGDKRWNVACRAKTCGCHGPMRKTEAGAVRAWNRRADD